MATASPLTIEDDVESAPRPRLTLEQFHALPDDPNVDRMLIRGRLWEKPMMKRNRHHARVETRIGSLLERWAEGQPQPQPEVFSGEVGCDLPELESGVGIDVAVVSPQLLAGLDEEEKYIIGAPILAVEILSPSDRTEEITAKVQDYLAAGVQAVWVVHPFFCYVVVHRPDVNPKMYSGDEQLSADPYLPGFSVPVSKLFRRNPAATPAEPTS